MTTPAANYVVEIGTGLLAQVGTRVDALLGGGLSAGRQRVFVVTSPEIWRLWGGQLVSGLPVAPTVLSVPAGEQHSGWRRLSGCWRSLLRVARTATRC